LDYKQGSDNTRAATSKHGVVDDNVSFCLPNSLSLAGAIDNVDVATDDSVRYVGKLRVRSRQSPADLLGCIACMNELDGHPALNPSLRLKADNNNNNNNNNILLREVVRENRDAKRGRLGRIVARGTIVDNAESGGDNSKAISVTSDGPATNLHTTQALCIETLTQVSMVEPVGYNKKGMPEPLMLNVAIRDRARRSYHEPTDFVFWPPFTIDSLAAQLETATGICKEAIKAAKFVRKGRYWRQILPPVSNAAVNASAAAAETGGGAGQGKKKKNKGSSISSGNITSSGGKTAMFVGKSHSMPTAGKTRKGKGKGKAKRSGTNNSNNTNAKGKQGIAAGNLKSQLKHGDVIGVDVLLSKMMAATATANDASVDNNNKECCEPNGVSDTSDGGADAKDNNNNNNNINMSTTDNDNDTDDMSCAADRVLELSDAWIAEQRRIARAIGASRSEAWMFAAVGGGGARRVEKGLRIDVPDFEGMDEDDICELDVDDDDNADDFDDVIGDDELDN
jgi:hypothetical protein